MPIELVTVSRGLVVTAAASPARLRRPRPSSLISILRNRTSLFRFRNPMRPEYRLNPGAGNFACVILFSMTF